MQFTEFHAGLAIDCGRRTVTQAEILEFASRYDPQWFHTDPARASAGRWAGLIASGWHTSAVTMRMFVDTVLADSTSFASPGLEYLKWVAPVRPGDELHLEAVVLEARRSESGRVGVVRWQWLTSNGRSELVLDAGATTLFDLTGSHRAVPPG
ncbi:MAG: MaoC/PaaZ C-terminal domain-containing protein [Steroidobacteraceae bacterium]